MITPFIIFFVSDDGSHPFVGMMEDHPNLLPSTFKHSSYHHSRGIPKSLNQIGLASCFSVARLKSGNQDLRVKIKVSIHHCKENTFPTSFVKLKTHSSHPFSIRWRIGIYPTRTSTYATYNHKLHERIHDTLQKTK
jgi:hypothetical protein